MTIVSFLQIVTSGGVASSGNQEGTPSSMNYCTHRWGHRLKKRLQKIESWAEKQVSLQAFAL